MNSALTTFSIAVTAFASFGAAPVAAQNILTNGDFEAGPKGDSAPGWTVETTGDPRSVSVVDGNDYIPCCGANGSQEALDNQFVSFGKGNSPTGLSNRIIQIYNANTGTQRLSFDFGVIGAAAQEMRFSVFDLTTSQFVLNTTVNQGPSNNFDTLFSTVSFDFLGQSNGQYAVQFANISDTVNSDSFLDNVSITAVPEPELWAIFIMGMVGVGFGLRRRRRLNDEVGYDKIV